MFLTEKASTTCLRALLLGLVIFVCITEPPLLHANADSREVTTIRV